MPSLVEHRCWWWYEWPIRRDGFLVGARNGQGRRRHSPDRVGFGRGCGRRWDSRSLGEVAREAPEVVRLVDWRRSLRKLAYWRRPYAFATIDESVTDPSPHRSAADEEDRRAGFYAALTVDARRRRRHRWARLIPFR